eukprot:CAMPEP_0114633304 /NCGR_PEP_ID=MMETSP0168-20121206/15384_1 /TAXON_ID=95228 ORGANISM="Vannella sp., Strain DIVA3 517/6/12" /NCGR_SAMPLE_ID=MMETSP0168 /ASSEMBLY_ACC=CAM_ASM_000044 /LENGTH=86 /DNA_ID=CAMNT_0001844947 /DNA_START=25 /DNA_END=285 /DNA_ORIENTATION=+
MATTAVSGPEPLSKTYLKDFDWKVQVMLGSDKIATKTSVPNLVLSLTLAKQDGSSEDVQLELTQEDLDHLLSELHKSQRVVKALKV